MGNARPRWPSTVRYSYYITACPPTDLRRRFFQQELGWQQTKVDELLLPIIQKMNKRGQVMPIVCSGSTFADGNLGRRCE